MLLTFTVMPPPPALAVPESALEPPDELQAVATSMAAPVAANSPLRAVIFLVISGIPPCSVRYLDPHELVSVRGHDVHFGEVTGLDRGRARNPRRARRGGHPGGGGFLAAVVG